MWKLPFAVVLFSLSVIVFIHGIQQSKKGNFYTDTPFLFPLGIFVWGDAIVLGLFWAVLALGSIAMSWMSILRVLFIFFALRSAFEVVYWLNQQAIHSEYMPPLFRRFHWLKAQDAAILYQLLNMCETVLMLSLLMLSFYR
jgi:hypothetical protein